jgi:hypothetical protein
LYFLAFLVIKTLDPKLDPVPYRYPEHDSLKMQDLDLYPDPQQCFSLSPFLKNWKVPTDLLPPPLGLPEVVALCGEVGTLHVLLSRPLLLLLPSSPSRRELNLVTKFEQFKTLFRIQYGSARKLLS